MNEPLLSGPSAARWRLNPFSRPKLPADPSPQSLAGLLHEVGVSRHAAKELDSYERAAKQASEDRKAKARLLLGTAGLVMGLSPAVPGVYSACHADAHSWDCGLRGLALAGGALALSSSLWLGWDLYHSHSVLGDAAQRVSDALSRAMHRKNGNVPVDDMFHRYRGWTRQERDEFTRHLHDYARKPKHSALANAAANALPV